MSKEMKLIMENWRNKIMSEQTKVDDIENPKSVEQLLGALKNKRVNVKKLLPLLQSDDSVGSAIKDIVDLIAVNPDKEAEINESIVDFLKNVAIDPEFALSGTPLGDKILKYAPATLALAFIGLKLASGDPEPFSDPETLKSIVNIIKKAGTSEELVTAAIETLQESKNENN